MPSPLTLVGVFVLGALVVVTVMVTYSLDPAPQDKVAAFRSQDVSKEDLRARYEAHLKAQTTSKGEIGSPASESSSDAAEVDTFFTLGSTKEWVSQIQGPPLKIQGRVWRYGFSTVTFSGDSVVGWVSSELTPLVVGMHLEAQRVYPGRYFAMGSSRGAVIALQGTPRSVEGNDWTYGDALVQFHADTVIFFQNDGRHTLKAL